MYPFYIIYLPNLCEASAETFYHWSNDQLTSEVAYKGLNVWFLKFSEVYKKLDNITLIQIFWFE